jgi:IS30 family transposase
MEELDMPKGYHHLTRDQRCQLYTLKARGECASLIANEIGVDRSTVYREVKRNSGERGYRYKQADEKAKERCYRASHRKLKMTDSIVFIIEEKLRMQWSPEQISGWLKKEGYETFVSHETIYKYIWSEKHMGGSLYKNLRHNGKKYNKRSKGTAGRGCIPGRIDIDERPGIVEEKTRLGDWELDTIIGSGQSGAIVSMVDRASKLTKLAKVSQKTAEEVKDALVENLKPIQDFVLTLTADNGKEFAYHQEVSHCLKTSFYFAKPYHSWERGLNEHTNGLVRQYFPKGKRFDEVSIQSLMEIEILLNNRPRKVLNFSTPLEVFSQLSKKDANVALRT